MNRSFLICRLRWPLFLLLAGVVALLHQFHVMSWWNFWPLALIFWGVMLLLERAAVREEDLPPYPGSYPGSIPGAYPGAYPDQYQGQYPGQYPGPNPAPYAGPAAAQPASATSSETSIVPLHGDEIIPPNRGGGQL